MAQVEAMNGDEILMKCDEPPVFGYVQVETHIYIYIIIIIIIYVFVYLCSYSFIYCFIKLLTYLCTLFTYMYEMLVCIYK